MSPETDEHKRIKEIILNRLKALYGTGLKEYPNSGQINDVYVITPNQTEVFVENIWTSTKSNFQRDLNILHRSSANVKILIANPEILRDNSLSREFEKTRMAERRHGVAVSDMIDGSRILTEPEFMDKEFIEIVEDLVKGVEDPISVSPGAISLGDQNWRVRSLFKVHNKTNEIYYQIWVKLTVDTPSMGIQDISIELPKPTDELHVDVGQIRLSGDIILFKGTDQVGRKAIYLVLSSLNPGEILPFILTNNSPDAPSTSSQLKAYIISFNREPAPSWFQPGKKGGFSFKPPETFKLESVSFLMKRL